MVAALRRGNDCSNGKSPLLFTLMTHVGCARHNSNHIIKFADDTTGVGLISDDDDSAYREEVYLLINW